CVPLTLASTPSSPIRIRTGSVLMNKPITRSAPAPPCIRPNNPVPNTTPPPLHPAEQHRPEYPILPPTHSRQHLRPCHMTHTRRTHSQLARSLPYPPRQPTLKQNLRFLYPRPVTLHIHQPKRRRRFLHIPQ